MYMFNFLIILLKIHSVYMPIDFANLITINRNWFAKEFDHHYTENINDKLKVRLFTIKPTGTIINSNSLANALLDTLPDYFKSKVEFEKEVQMEIARTVNDYTTATDLEQREQAIKLVTARTYKQAAKFFRTKNSDSKSGKYGELLLFAIVESLLGCKMVAHKITNLTNYHDEVKGGDGIFLGDYEFVDGRKNIAYVIGESKVWKNYSGAKTDALDSINRFYDAKVQATFNSLEFFIAHKDISKFVDEDIDINELYDRLNPNSQLFKEQVAIHPILIMYDTPGYDKFMRLASNKEALVNLITQDIQTKLKKNLERIGDKVKLYPELEKVYLDFILIPVNSVDSFNKTMDDLI